MSRVRLDRVETEPVRRRIAFKSRGITIALALFLGGLGIHRFYLNRPGSGVVYLLFCWTGIPLILSLLEVVGMLLTSNRAFDRKYNYADD